MKMIYQTTLIENYSRKGKESKCGYIQILSAIIGLSAGMLVAAGLFSFITGLGVISDFADRTHTGEHVMLYEDAIVVGGILGNLLFVFKIHIPGGG